VRLGPSTPGDYVRARVLVPRNPGVTQSAKTKRRYTRLSQAAYWGFAANPRLKLVILLELLEVLLHDFIFS
jgi:hypothetical protein